MDNEEDILCVATVVSWPWRQEFKLTADAVVRSSTSYGGGNKVTEMVPLDSLSSKLSYQSKFANGARQPLEKAFVLLGLAVCIFFSEFSPHIPLLAPFLALIGLPFLTRGLCRLKQYEWTIIEKKNGERALFIAHRGISKADREAFETKLVEAIVAVRNR